MTSQDLSTVPLWTLSTSSTTNLPALMGEGALSPARLTELRTALAAFADSPIVTLEARPLPTSFDRSTGITLDALSPLAQQLAQLVKQTAKTSTTVTQIESAGEVLYRMHVPAKVAAQVGKGLVKPMASKAVKGGVHGALMGAHGIVAQATYVPVAAETASVAAASGAAGAAGVAVAGAGALTVAAPLVLMAIAVAISANADRDRQRAIENITELLEKLHLDRLDNERDELDGCRDAIDKATAVLLDQGEIGASLGLDSAVHAIGIATETARRRAHAWRTVLDALPTGPIDVTQIEKAFPGIDGPGGEFRAHVELCALAIALRRRVIVLQAVEHSQSDPSKLFENFVSSLRADQRRVNELESDITAVLMRLASLELRSPSRLKDRLMTRGQVDDLLLTVYRLRELSEGTTQAERASDVVIEIARSQDGSLLVLPAAAA